MPAVEIDLESPYAGWPLMAVMHWPDDPLARDNFLATFAAAAMQNIQDKLPKDGMLLMLPDIATQGAVAKAEASLISVEAAFSTITGEINRRLFRPSGGYGRVAAAGGREAILKEAEQQGWTFGGSCGVVLTYIVRLATHHPDITASVNRATHILVKRAKKEGRRIPAERNRKTMWTRWGGVSPLWAVFAFCDAAKGRGAHYPAYCYVPEFRHEMISVSLWLADFAVQFKPIGARAPLLSENKAIRLNCKLHALKPEIPPLTDEELAWARAYRAPMPPP